MIADLLLKYKAARRVSTPLIVVTTPDPAATVLGLNEWADGSTNGPRPLLAWDVVGGLRPIASANEANTTASKAAMAEITEGVDPMAMEGPQGLIEVLKGFQRAPKQATLYVYQGHRAIEDPSNIQALWILRDILKQNGSAVVLLAPDVTLPAELERDVLVLDEPLPSRPQLEQILQDVYEAVEMPLPEDLTPLVDAITGLSAFAAEQVAAMSITKDGMDIDALWERKRQSIEQTPGLTVWRGNEKVEDIGGMANAKAFLGRVMGGRAKPGCIVFIDEIEKALGGTGAGPGGGGGDTSGVSQDQLGVLLREMQDRKAKGVLIVGPPGTGKSLFAKAAGNLGEIPTVALDFGAMKGSLVGQSEEYIRRAFKVMNSISGGSPMFVATCNRVAGLPVELRRRFTHGTFFFDFPNAEEKAAIWAMYETKYEVNGQQHPEDINWTGAEIERCCSMAWETGCSLVEAARYIVPVYRAARDTIEALRSEATGRYISASHDGPYMGPEDSKETLKTATGRKIALSD